MQLFSTALLSMLLTWGASSGLNAGLTFALPLNDAGAGAVNTAVTSTGGSGTPTFTRATAAAAKLSTGLWNLAVASGTARSHYLGANTVVGAYGGYLAEGARTNLCLQSRDLSNASWTKVNTTGTKDQVGIDGVTNSASSLTATLGGGTCLQTITEAATDSTLSMYIKRITGVGTVTIQQGATTSDITAQINSVTYTQVVLDATVLNPAIGIVLGTNGDQIAVDCVQFENGAFASTPIPTTTVAVTRNADVLTYPSAGNAVAAAGTIYCECTVAGAAGSGQKDIFSIDTSGAQNFIGNGAYQIFTKNRADTSQVGLSTAVAGAVFKFACNWLVGGNFNGAVGGVVGTPASQTATPTLTTINIGHTGGAAQLFGTLKNGRIWQRQLPDATLQALTT